MSNTNTVVSLTPTRIRNAVERAAELNARIHGLQEELDEIKATFKSMGDGTYLGRDHVIQVTTAGRTSMDMAEVKARLTPADFVECVVVTEVTRVTIKGV